MTGGNWSDPDAAIASVEEQIRQAQETAQRAQALERDLHTLVGRAASSRREVSAEVSSSGLITSLTLTPAALEFDERSLAHLVMDTVNAAHRQVGEQAVALSAEAFGDDSPITERLRAEAAAREIPPAGGLER